ncbi:MAG: hypothetical protein AAB546_03185 [Patescibacteria group bacterium]
MVETLEDFIESRQEPETFFGDIFPQGTYSCGTERRREWGKDVKPGTLTHMCASNPNFAQGKLAPFCQISLFKADSGYDCVIISRDLSNEGRVMFERQSPESSWIKYEK